MERLSIQELAAVLTVKNGLKKKEAEQFVAMIFEVVKDNLMSERLVKIKGLGTFKVVDIEPRESVNVNTGERVLIEGHEKIAFTPDTAMKELVNKPFSQFETVILNDGVDFSNENANTVPFVEQEVEDDTEEFVPPVADEPVAIPVAEEVVEEPVEEVVEEPVEEVVEEPVEEVVVVPVEEITEVPIEEAVVVPYEEIVESPVEEVTEVPVEEVTEAAPIEEVVEVPYKEVIEPPVEEVVEMPREKAAEPLTDEMVEALAFGDGNGMVEMPTEETEESWEAPHDDEEPEVADDEEEEYEEKKTRRSSVSKIWVFLAFIACVLSFLGGYQLGVYQTKSDLGLLDSAQVVEKAPVMSVGVDTASTMERDTAKADTIKAESQPVAETPAPEVQPAAPQPKEQPQAKPVKTEAAETSEVDYRKYEQMDIRVRTGAYRIVGTAQEVTVKEGETIEILTRRYLGPEMECYVEVYNGLSANAPLKAGQKIKIPRVQWKVKRTE